MVEPYESLTRLRLGENAFNDSLMGLMIVAFWLAMIWHILSFPALLEYSHMKVRELPLDGWLAILLGVCLTLGLGTIEHRVIDSAHWRASR
jgi:hypothetical protein